MIEESWKAQGSHFYWLWLPSAPLNGMSWTHSGAELRCSASPPWLGLPSGLPLLKLTQVEGPSPTLNFCFVPEYVLGCSLGLASELPYWNRRITVSKMGSLVPSSWCSQLCPPLPVWWILRQVFSFPGKYLELRTTLHSVSLENSFYNSALELCCKFQGIIWRTIN